MAVLMIQETSTETFASYDVVLKQLEAGGQRHPAGRQSHVAVRKEARRIAGVRSRSEVHHRWRAGQPR